MSNVILSQEDVIDIQSDTIAKLNSDISETEAISSNTDYYK